MDPARVVKLLRERQTSVDTFRDLRKALGDTVQMLQGGELQV